MKIQRGIVEYKGRNDIECMYAVTDDKKVYYFLDSKDEKKFSNGSRLASTVLLEVVDAEAPKSHIGVLGENGEELIAFTHREIVPINEENSEILLAKLADPVTPCVVEANKAKNDPTLATKLVSNQAQIKDKMKSRMGTDGIFLFHNQFLEATVYDISGRNLAGDGYYSFIGFSKGKLFFSLNTADSEIIETSLFPIDENTTDSSINVEEAVIEKDVVESALENSYDLPPIVDQDSSSDGEQALSSLEKSDGLSSDDNFSDSVPSEKENTIELDASDDVNIDEEKDDVQSVEEELFDLDEKNDKDTIENNNDNEQSKKDVAFPFPIEDENDSKTVEEEKIDTDREETDDFLPEISENTDSLDNELFDSNEDNDVDVVIDNADSYDSNYYEDSESIQDVSYDRSFDNSLNSNIGDVASFISRLMERHKDILLTNKKLLQSNQNLKSSLKKVTDSKNDILRKNGMMEQKIEMQEQRIKKQEVRITSLMDRLQELDGKNQEMSSRINSYQKELKNYSSQKAELEKVLKDAKEFLKDDSYHFNDDDDYSFAA